MNLVQEVKQIVEKYGTDKIKIPNTYKNLQEYLKFHPNERKKFCSYKNEWYFIKKYRKNISSNTNGFTLGKFVLFSWGESIDGVLEKCVKFDPDMIIVDVGINFGSLVFNVHSNYKDIDEVKNFMENMFYDRSLSW